MRTVPVNQSDAPFADGCAPLRVKDLIVGHDDVRDPEQSSTRGRVYLDPRDFGVLARAQALMEHARTTWAVSGRDFVPEPAACHVDDHDVEDDG
jgi:hypothetical protein